MKEKISKTEMIILTWNALHDYPKLKFRVRAGVKVKGFKRGVADFVLYRDGEPRLVIECRPGGSGEEGERGRKLSRLLKVPCLYLRGRKDAEKAPHLVEFTLNYKPG